MPLLKNVFIILLFSGVLCKNFSFSRLSSKASFSTTKNWSSLYTMQPLGLSGKKQTIAATENPPKQHSRHWHSHTNTLMGKLDLIGRELKMVLNQCNFKESESINFIEPAILQWSNLLAQNTDCYSEDADKLYKNLPLHKVETLNILDTMIMTNIHRKQIENSEFLASCPSYTKVNEDSLRLPKLMVEVVCQCERSCGPTTSYRCTSIKSLVEVIRDSKVVYERISVACVCMDRGSRLLPDIRPIIIE